MKATKILTWISVCCMMAATSWAEDWPQWLGPQRDSVWREEGIVKSLPEGRLNAEWRSPIGAGYAGPAVAQGRVFVTDYVISQGEISNNPGRRIRLQGEERIVCFDADEGTLLWKHSYDCPYEVSYPSGPRTTPCVVDGKVYALGAMGDLRCVSADTGKLVWEKDLKKEYQTETPIWGFAGHPLVDGDKLFCLVGGSGSVAVAFHKDTGEEIWRNLSAREPGYCPPVLIGAGGTRQLVIWHSESINGLNPETGEVYWSVPLKPDYAMSIATPRKSGDLLFASGVGNAGVVLRLDAQAAKAEVLWRGTPKTAVYCANSSPFVEDNVIYGVCRQGELRGVDLRTGERLWETFAATSGTRRAGYATAFIVKHEDRFFLANERGELIIAKLTPEGYQEQSRAQILEPTNETFGRPVVWSHPAFANRCIYARNDRELVCVSLAAE
jgi:outer membrane protein assembly factor BamB